MIEIKQVLRGAIGAHQAVTYNDHTDKWTDESGCLKKADFTPNKGKMCNNSSKCEFFQLYACSEVVEELGRVLEDETRRAKDIAENNLKDTDNNEDMDNEQEENGKF